MVVGPHPADAGLTPPTAPPRSPVAPGTTRQRQVLFGRSDHAERGLQHRGAGHPAREPPKICQARTDFATRLRTRYVFSPWA